MQIRVRKDLQTFSRGSGMDGQWVVKDPISFNHFLFSREELFLLNLFDGKRTLDQIRNLWQQEFKTRSLTMQQLQRTAERLVRDNLVVIEHFGTGLRLHQDERRSKRAQMVMKLSSPLVINLGGVDPRELLRLLWLPGQILFNRFVVLANLAFAFLVFGYFIGHFEEIIRRAATMSGFFTLNNFFIMTLIIIGVKIVHELGHALACQKFGGECFEIGVLLLSFIPTLYCNVTDSWTFDNRWKRIMVSFAGIYVEILLATMAAILWLLTGPSLANSIFFNVAIMCSVNTIFVNGNPLLRYDGYYIFSDLVEQPNLAQNARLSLRQMVSGWFFDQEEFGKKNAWLAMFGLLSLVYRWIVVFSIATGIYLILKKMNFGLLSEGAVVFILATVGFRMFWHNRLERQRIKRRFNFVRSFAVLICLALVAFGVFVMPFPSHLYCNFFVESSSSSVVYAPRNGKLELGIEPYTHVQSGQYLGQIIDLEFTEERQQTVKYLENLEDRAKRLSRRFEQGPVVASEVQLLKDEIEKVQAKLNAQNIEANNLILTSANDGVIRPLFFDEYRNRPTELSLQMSGSLFDTENQECYVQRGQPLFVVENEKRRLVAYLGETDVEFLAAGQKVTLFFNQTLHRKFNGAIQKIIQVDVKLNEEESASSGIETFVDQTGAIQTLQTPYRVIISVDQFPQGVLVNSGGRARISVPMRTIAQKVWFVLDRWWQEQNY